MVRQQPAHAVMRRIRQLLVGGEREDDVAVGLEALLHVGEHVGDEDRRHGLVVDHAAAAEIAVDLVQLERIGVPVRALGFHDVEMREEEQRLAARRCRAAAPPGCPCAAPRRGPGCLAPEARRRAAAPPWPRPRARSRRRNRWCRSRPARGRCRRRPPAPASACRLARRRAHRRRGSPQEETASVTPRYGSSLRRNAAIFASCSSFAKSSAEGICGLSRAGVHHAEEAERLALAWRGTGARSSAAP